jgi:hypothetical protein
LVIPVITRHREPEPPKRIEIPFTRRSEPEPPKMRQYTVKVAQRLAEADLPCAQCGVLIEWAEGQTERRCGGCGEMITR